MRIVLEVDLLQCTALSKVNSVDAISQNVTNVVELDTYVKTVRNQMAVQNTMQNLPKRFCLTVLDKR